jgi:hypothetical protein
MAAWIRIRILNADQDPDGLKRAEMMPKNTTKSQIIRHEKV